MNKLSDFEKIQIAIVKSELQQANNKIHAYMLLDTFAITIFVSIIGRKC